MKHRTSNTERRTSNPGGASVPASRSFSVRRSMFDVRCFLFFLLFLSVFPANAAETQWVSHTNAWNYHKGTNAPQANWQTISDASLNKTWSSGNGGFGYASNLAETNDCR